MSTKIDPAEMFKTDQPNEISDSIKIENLNISDSPFSPKENKSQEFNPQENFVSIVQDMQPKGSNGNLSKEDAVHSELIAHENTPEDPQNDERALGDIEIPFPPILYKRKKKKKNGQEDDEGSIYELNPRDASSSDESYASDDTCTNYVECGEEGLCKCRRMQGRNYYDYYESVADRVYYEMYPKGKCTLPMGTILHFTTESEQMQREDVKAALEALGAKVEFVDYYKYNYEGWVRLSYPHEARVIIKKMENKTLKIVEADVLFRVLSGKEEKRYLKKVINAIHRVQSKKNSLSNQLKKAGYKYV